MSTDQLQLTLIPEPHHRAQPLPPEVREMCVVLLARMLLCLVRPEEVRVNDKECRDESR
jgi:hypothetical protein